MYLMCRLCFADEGVLELIFDIEKSLIKTISDNLFEFKDIDGWPTGICEECKIKLTSATIFFDICKNSHKVLLEQLGETPFLQDSNHNMDTNRSNEESLKNDDLELVSNTEPVDQVILITSTDNESLLEELIIPSKQDIKEELLFKCTDCEKSFHSKISLALHIRVHRRKTSENSIKMKPTNIETSKNESSDSNLEDSSRQDHFKCTDCKKLFDSKVALTYHMRTHVRKKPIRCTKCRKSFKFQGNLINHMLICHSNKMKRTRTSDSESTLNVGKISKNLRERPFKCTVCEKSFIFRGNLTNHMKAHVQEKLEDSQQRSVNDSETSNDESSHSTQLNSKKNPIRCTKCKRSFLYQRSLIYHMWNLHSIKIKMKRNKNYDSETSEDESSDPSLYIRTTSVNSQERPFQCTICKESYKTQGCLINHMQKFHSIEMKRNPLHVRTVQNRIKCSLCHKVFPTNSQLRIHLVVHSSKRPFKCRVCKKDFKLKITLLQHQKIHRSEKEFKCATCGKDFNFKCNFNSHLQTHAKKSQGNNSK